MLIISAVLMQAVNASYYLPGVSPKTYEPYEPVGASYIRLPG